jgi:hypothetical protein
MAGTKILSAFLIMVPATVLLTTEATLSEPAAEQCKASPGGSAPRGQHWYYRSTSRGSKQRYWYLAPAGAHVKSRAATAAVADPTATQNANPIDADNAASAQDMTADSAEPAKAQTNTAQTNTAQADTTRPAPAAFAQLAQAQAASAQTPLPQAPPADQAATADQAAGGPGFGARWPEDLPKADDLDQGEPAPVSNSYAEPRDTDATAQMPSQWPGAEAGRTAQASAGETVLRYFSIAGILLIPLLLAGGWVAKYSREPHRSMLRERLWALHDRLLEMAGRLSQRLRRRGDAVEDTAFVGSAPPLSPAVSGRRVVPDWRERAPTDPAQDLKTSLAELMRDLRRADEPGAPARHAERSRYVERSYDRADERAFSPSLQPAE